MLIPILLISFALWLLGDRIYHWDLNVVYGRVLKKLDEILADMELLKAEYREECTFNSKP
jgi:hypothetical protein